MDGLEIIETMGNELDRPVGMRLGRGEQPIEVRLEPGRLLPDGFGASSQFQRGRVLFQGGRDHDQTGQGKDNGTGAFGREKRNDKNE
jgi:hypothetical protein